MSVLLNHGHLRVSLSGALEGGKLTMSRVDYHSKSLLLEEWGMLGLCHYRGFYILCKEATFWPLKNFSQWKLDSNMNFSYQDSSKKVQTVYHLWRWSDGRVIYPMWDKTCFSISVFLNLCDSQLVFFSISVFLNLCDSQLVFFSISAFLN